MTKTPPASYFLKKAAGIEKGSQTTGRGSTVGKVTMAQIREIAEQKMPDLNANDIEARLPHDDRARPARWAWKWWSRRHGEAESD